MALALPWDDAAAIAGIAAVAGIALRRSGNSRRRAAGAFALEAALIIGLYGLWQLAGRLSLMGIDDAMARASAIAHAEAFLPSIPTMQHLILWSPVLVQIANIYYAVVHFPATIALLIWLFLRHRDIYPGARWVLVLTTFTCLAIQLVPVAPPRMLPGVVDTGITYGQSVYGGGFGAAEYAAMPSVHVAWALAVAWYIWHGASARWRWIGPAHAVMTVFVVVVTGNHWWLDGVVAAVILGAAIGAVSALSRVGRRYPATTTTVDATRGIHP